MAPSAAFLGGGPLHREARRAVNDMVEPAGISAASGMVIPTMLPDAAELAGENPP